MQFGLPTVKDILAGLEKPVKIRPPKVEPQSVLAAAFAKARRP